MKSYIKIIIILFLAIPLTGCETDFTNVNQPSDKFVLSSKEGLFGVVTGMTEHFATTVLAPVVEVPGLSTRELGNTNTFLTPTELVLGGTPLPNENAGINRLWSQLLRNKSMAESILDNVDNVDNVDIERGTIAGLKAYAKLFKAINLGYLIQNFEQAPINNSLENASFSSRDEVLKECIRLLNSANADLAANTLSEEFTALIPSKSLPDLLHFFLARYNLLAGNDTEAIAAAGKVDLSKKSEWTYDGTATQNPVWSFAVNDNPDTQPQDSFGLVGVYTPNPLDERINFYLDATLSLVETNYGQHPVDNLKGFFDAASTSIPIYLPGEIYLIKAEAHANQGDFTNAILNINLVRQKKAANDIFGVGANLPAYLGTADLTPIMDEIFKQRSIELFMSGMRLEDSRRIHSNLTIPEKGDYTIERNRNYYPYPFSERENNTATPTDPKI